MKTVSLELSKQLKENGYPQDLTISFNYWVRVKDLEGRYLRSRNTLNDTTTDFIASPTADELLEQLPARITNPSTRNMDRLTFFFKGHAGDDSKQDVRDGFTLEYWTNYSQPLTRIKGDTLADACAKMWLHLKKEGLL